MNVQKSKITIAVTTAAVFALLLGGVSFTFFPSQTLADSSVLSLNSFVSTSESPPSPLQYYVGSNNSSSSSPLTGIWGVVSICPTLPGMAIEKNGNINSTSAPIKRNGDAYTLTGDITNQTIIVQRSDIVLNGDQYTLKGFVHGCDWALENFDLQDVQNVTIENFNVSLSWQGIWIQNCSNIVIKNNSISNVNTAIDVNSANDTTVTDNTINNANNGITYTSFYGFGPSVNNDISKNNVTGPGGTGISLSFSTTNKVTDNIVVNEYDPIYAGPNSTINGNTVLNGIDGISADSFDVICDNVISNFSESGLLLGGDSSVIYSNVVANCTNAVLNGGENITLYNNSFLNYTHPLLLLGNSSQPINNWDKNGRGNYWSGYEGTDHNGEGIGDTPYSLGGNNTDYYPLVQPAVVQTLAVNSSMGQRLFELALLVGAVGLVVSLCLYVKSLRSQARSQA